MGKSRRDHGQRIPGRRVVGQSFIRMAGDADVILSNFVVEHLRHVILGVFSTKTCQGLHFFDNSFDCRLFVVGRRNSVHDFKAGFGRGAGRLFENHLRYIAPGLAAKRVCGVSKIVPVTDLLQEYSQAHHTHDNCQPRKTRQFEIGFNRQEHGDKQIAAIGMQLR